MIEQTNGRDGSGVGAMFRPRSAGGRVFAGGTALAFGLLLWTKLILVTNHPKTAIAAPPAMAPASELSDVEEPDALDGMPSRDVSGDVGSVAGGVSQGPPAR